MMSLFYYFLCFLLFIIFLNSSHVLILLLLIEFFMVFIFFFLMMSGNVLNILCLFFLMIAVCVGAYSISVYVLSYNSFGNSYCLTTFFNN